MRRAAGLGIALLLSVWLVACASPGPRYHHNRYDYWAFRGRVGLLPDPNYLPWVMHAERLPDGARALVACRWPDAAFPLRYRIELPAVPADLQDEFNPIDPEEYRDAVERALRSWQNAIGLPVRFMPAGRDDAPDFTVRLHAELNAQAGVQVLGLVRDEESQCTVTGAGEAMDVVGIDFAVRAVHLYLLDEIGLLAPHQVYTVALHELGHLLGASGQHSPLRGDVMYRVADDGRVESLSEHDLNTFRALYRVAPGSVYARLDDVHAAPVPQIRRVPPRLDRRVIDERNDFAVTLPRGWQVIRSPRGWVGVDGVSWDHDASIQVIARRGTLRDFFERQRIAAELRGDLVDADVSEVDGRLVARVSTLRGTRLEEVSFIDWGNGWGIVMVADAPAAYFPLYHPWFRLVLLSIERPTDPPPVPASP